MNLLATNSYPVFIASSVAQNDVYLAWGEFGTMERWTTTVPEIDPSLPHLHKEVCRRLILDKSYLKVDKAGTIDAAGLKFSVSLTPTRTVLFKVKNLPTDASDKTICQIGVYVNTQTPVTGDKTLLTPLQITDKGYMLFSANITPIIRNSGTSESRELIINF